jgi:Fic family protein
MIDDSGLTLLYEKADRYKNRIASARPLGAREAKNLDEYFKVGLTFSSNALEGNTLTITETKVLLEDGLTVGGKPIRDYYEATGHARAYELMLTLARQRDTPLLEEQILKLHQLFYALLDEENAGVYRKVSIFITGTDYVPPAPNEVPSAMKAYVAGMNALRGSVHPIEYAARLHQGLAAIHPFVDGNGRTARLLMNLALVQDGFGIAIIPPVRRGEYIDALRAAQRAKHPDDAPFLSLMAECVIETQRDYCRLLQLPTRDDSGNAW